MDLPTRIPLFPLPNVVLFPGVPLPLHVFEPRYREMVRDAQATHGIIGMVLLKGDWRQDYYGRPPIFSVGCAGRIVSLESLPDGRSNILLRGIRQFSIIREAGSRSYREAEIEWQPAVVGTGIAAEQRRHLMALLEQFLSNDAEPPIRKLLQDQSLSDELLVNFFSYALDLLPLEKQGLLETPSLSARAQQLCEVLEFRLEETRLAAKAPASGDRWH
ncbi:MAG TPA: LON peptidase substrate-binding domain-containing protein [Candidatus Binatia bacterium]|nr:LON peptidase substrate-binding domain-containing protein [Candidatus Binatia bacterium]